MVVGAFLDSMSLLVERGFVACTLVDAEMVARMGVAALGRVALAFGDARVAVSRAMAAAGVMRWVGWMGAGSVAACTRAACASRRMAFGEASPSLDSSPESGVRVLSELCGELSCGALERTLCSFCSFRRCSRLATLAGDGLYRLERMAPVSSAMRPRCI